MRYKPCHACGIEKPIEYFRREKENICKQCENLRNAQYKTETKIAKGEERFNQLRKATELVRDIGVPHMAIVAVPLLEEFGGIAGYVRKMHDTFNAAKPGSPTQALILRDVREIMQIAKSQEVPKPDVEGMSDDDINEEIENLIAKARRIPNTIDALPAPEQTTEPTPETVPVPCVEFHA